MYSTPVVASIGIGMLVALSIALASMFNFSLAGPDVGQEIRQRYRFYMCFALLRLVAWIVIISTWLSLLGMFSYAAFVDFNGLAPTLFGYIGAGLASVFVVSILQFFGHLVHIPSTIIMSSNYRASRLYALRNLLSVSNVRWLKLMFSVILIVSPIVHFLSEDGSYDRGVILFSMVVLYLPWLYVVWPVDLAIRKVISRQRGNASPNIVLIGSDTFRVDRIGAAGYKRDTTPFLDVLVKKGRLFTNCYTPQARTAPSLLSLLTGTWPNTHEVKTNFSSAMNEGVAQHALAAQLSENGYKTVALSDWAGSDLKKYPMGFDKVEASSDQWNIKYLIRQGPKTMRLFLSLYCHNRFGQKFLPEIFYMAGTPLNKYLGARARQWISKFSLDSTPFFINIFMATTHPPFGTEYPYYKYYADDNYAGESKFAMARLVDPMDIIRSQQEPKEAFDLEQINDLYDGCVRCFDDEVRKIVRHIHDCGLADNTVVVIYSDHGMELFEHDTWGQGNSAEGEASPKIPILVSGIDGIMPGVDKRVIRSIDVLPTLLELCEIGIPSVVEGKSFVNYLHSNVVDEDRVAFFETGEWLATPPNQSPCHLTYPGIVELLRIDNDGSIVFKEKYVDKINKARDIMVRKGEWKLVRFPLKSGDLYKLFDLSRDPECKVDLSGEFPERVNLLKPLLISLCKEAG